MQKATVSGWIGSRQTGLQTEDTRGVLSQHHAGCGIGAGARTAEHLAIGALAAASIEVVVFEQEAHERGVLVAAPEIALAHIAYCYGQEAARRHIAVVCHENDAPAVTCVGGHCSRWIVARQVEPFPGSLCFLANISSSVIRRCTKERIKPGLNTGVRYATGGSVI